MTNDTNGTGGPTAQAVTSMASGATGPMADTLSRLPMFGPPPLLPGDDAKAYDDLLTRVSAALKLSDIFEEIWTQEIVALIWEEQRCRRYQQRRIKVDVATTVQHCLKDIFDKKFNYDLRTAKGVQDFDKMLAGNGELVDECLAGDAAAIQKVNRLLGEADVSLEGLTALTFERELDKIERFNRLIASAEWRWNALLHEIERRRAFFAEKVRRERPNIEAPKFKTITADTNAPVN